MYCLRSVFSALAVGAAVVSAEAGAQAATMMEVMQACDSFDVKASIPACTVLIDERRLPDKIRALAYYKRGMALFALKNTDGAVADFEASCKLDPTDAGAFNELGLGYYLKGDYQRAVTVMGKAIALKPNAADPYYNRGGIHRKTGQLDLAIADFSAAVKIGVSQPAAFIENGTIKRADELRLVVNYYKELAKTYIMKGERRRAFDVYDDAIQKFPQYAFVYQIRGEGYASEGDFERAKDDFSKAAVLEPNSAQLYLAKGFVNFQTGDYAASAADFTKAWSLNPQGGPVTKEYASLWLYLGQARTEKQAAAAGLKQRSGLVDQTSWPFPVARLFLGQIKLAEMQQAASTPDERCEAQFYGGEWSLLNGDKPSARASLESALKTCASDAAEHIAARSELSRLAH